MTVNDADPIGRLRAMQQQDRQATSNFAAYMEQQLVAADEENAARRQDQADADAEMWDLVSQIRNSNRPE